MNKLVAIFSIITSFYTLGQLPTLDWVKSAGGSGYEYGNSTKIDQNGNVYTTGIFRSTTDFDPGIGDFSLTPNGDQDIFLLKLDANGNFIWCIGFGGGSPSSSYNDTGHDLAFDSQGNVIVTGIYKGTCDFDPGIGTFNISSNSGNPDIFIAKYSPLGAFLWAKGIGGISNDMATSIDVDLVDNIYISGQFYGNTDFDPGSGTYFLSPSLPNSNGTFSISSQIFHLKLNSNGDFLWANQTGDYSDDLAFSKIDLQGSMFSTGRFAGTVDFDPGAGVSNLTSPASYYGIFVRKLDTSGNFVWAHGFNGSLSSEGTSIATDTNGDVIVSGFFQGTVDFDPGIGIYNLTSNGGTDAFLLKLSNNGNFIWVKQIASNSPSTNESFSSVTIDNQNNVYAIGNGTSNINTIDLDPSTGSFFLPNDYGTYLVKLNQLGDFVWAISAESSLTSNFVTLCQTTTGAGGAGWDGGFCIDVSDNAIYITGAYDHTVDFDPNSGTFNLTATNNDNSKDLFVHKLLLCQNSTSYISISSCSNYTAPSGSIHAISEIFNDTIPNVAGCDSIITINLTINQNTSSSISPSSCGSYTAPDGQIYTTDGNYIAIIPNAQGCDSTISISLTVLTIPTISAGVDQTVCEGTTVTLSGSGGVVYNWDNGVMNGVAFGPPVGINEYVVSGTSVNGCVNSDTVMVTVNELPVVSFSSNMTSGCSPFNLNLTNNYQYQTCTWTVNGVNYSECDVLSLTLTNADCYDVSLQLTTSQGCMNQSTLNDYICVFETPTASFTTSTTTISDLTTLVSFTNNSTNATSYGWNFDDLNPYSTETNPTHLFSTNQASDTFNVQLYAYSVDGCSDTVNIMIYYNPLNSTPGDIFIPTGVSPNNDNENDSWTVTGLEKYPNAIINVFNRWGQLLFEGGTGNSTWNGLYQGEILPTADYYYIVDLGNGTKFNGVVTLKQ